MTHAIDCDLDEDCLCQPAPDPWPVGAPPFNLEPMLRAARTGPLTPELAQSIVLTAAAYIDSLPPEIQAEVAHRLNAALDAEIAAGQAAVTNSVTPEPKPGAAPYVSTVKRRRPGRAG